MIDVEALLESARTDYYDDGSRCSTCRWLKDRPRQERTKWESALEETGSYTHAQVSRAMRSADPDGQVPAPHSISNHRSGHQVNRRPKQ